MFFLHCFFFISFLNPYNFIVFVKLSIGRPKYKSVLPNSAQTDCYIGNTKDESKGLFKIKYPITHGVITNWNDMDLIWKYCFSELHVNPRQVLF